MSTRSTIAIRRTDGTQTKIYCHYDGYIEGVGVTLQLAYNTKEKVEELLALGNLSVLGYYTESRDKNENGTIAYHRDRGEEFEQCPIEDEQEFNYLFDESEGVWYVEYTEFKKTFASKKLGMFGCEVKARKLLLDALAEIDWDSFIWNDDDFAKNGEVMDRCTEKAIEGRKEANSDV